MPTIVAHYLCITQYIDRPASIEFFVDFGPGRTRANFWQGKSCQEFHKGQILVWCHVMISTVKKNMSCIDSARMDHHIQMIVFAAFGLF